MSAELVVAILVALIGSQWFGNIIVDRFSKSSNKKILERIEKLEHKVDENEADRARERILHYNTEILRHQKHTKEDFNDILIEIDNYEDFCSENEDYPNNRAVLAIENIKNVYRHCMETDDFL